MEFEKDKNKPEHPFLKRTRSHIGITLSPPMNVKDKEQPHKGDILQKKSEGLKMGVFPIRNYVC